MNTGFINVYIREVLVSNTLSVQVLINYIYSFVDSQKGYDECFITFITYAKSLRCDTRFHYMRESTWL